MTGDEDTRNGPKGRDPARDDDKGLRAEVISRLRAQLTLLRVQVRRLHDALHQAENLRAAAQERLSSLRGTTDRLEQALLMEEAAQGGGGAPFATACVDEPPAWRLVAEEMRRPVTFTVALDLSDRHIHALLASGVLSINDVEHPATVGRVVQTLIDRWSEQYRDRTSALSGSAGALAGDERTATAAVLAADDAAVSEAALPPLPQPAATQPNDAVHPGDNIVWLDRPRARRSGAGTHRPSAPQGAVVMLSDAQHAHVHAHVHARTPHADTAGSGAAGRAAPQTFAGVDGECGPDAHEADQPVGGERLVEHQYGDRQVPGWGEVLQQPYGGEADAARAGDEQDQR